MTHGMGTSVTRRVGFASDSARQRAAWATGNGSRVSVSPVWVRTLMPGMIVVKGVSACRLLTVEARSNRVVTHQTPHRDQWGGYGEASQRHRAMLLGLDYWRLSSQLVVGKIPWARLHPLPRLNAAALGLD